MDNIPFGEQVADWSQVDPELRAWMEQCPTQLLEKFREKGTYCTFRVGKKYNNDTTFNRIRVSFDISAEAPFAIQPQVPNENKSERTGN